MDNRLLPNPLIKPDGMFVRDAAEWEKQREYLRSLAQEHMYGIWPGKAERVEGVVTACEELYGCRVIHEAVTLTYAYGGVDSTLDLCVYRPNDGDRHPVIITNSCLHFPRYGFGPTEMVVARGYAVIDFIHCDIVPDMPLIRYYGLPVDEQKVYPKLPCRTIMAWGWGHSVIADYVLSCGYAGDLIVAGASRGGKAALCCGIFDERFSIVAPTISGCGGTGAVRFCGTIDGARQDSERSETIGRMTEVFPDWFTDVYASYGAHMPPYTVGEEVNGFPLDANILRALIAPRAVFSSDGEEDHWSNPFGTQLAWMAAQPVFDMLGVPENNCFHLRPGGHRLDLQDWEAMLDYCDQRLGRSMHSEHRDLNRPRFDVDISHYAQ